MVVVGTQNPPIPPPPILEESYCCAWATTSYDPAILLEQFWRHDFSLPERSLLLKSLTQSEKQLFIIPIIMCMDAICAMSSYWPPPAPLPLPYPPKDIFIK